MMNPKTLAEAVERVEGSLRAYPYDPFSRDESEWWLLPPEADHPAFKYGKAFFDAKPAKMPPGIPQGDIYCGFYVEKGLSPTVREALNPDDTPRWFDSYIMGSDWRWGEVVTGLQSSFPPFSDDLLLTISTSTIPPAHRDTKNKDYTREFYAHKEKFSGGRVCFQKHGKKLGRIQALPGADRGLAQYLVGTVANATDLTQLASALAKLPAAYNWAWVDFYVGIPIPANSKVKTTAAQFSKNHLALWRGWLR